MNRKGVELSMNVIIIAAIALLVLVILSVLILRSGNIFAKGTSCDGVGGECRDSCDELAGEVTSRNSCPNPEDNCCVPLLNEES